MDATFEFEKRRNVPVRYDRNLWIKTIQAMKRIQAIRQVRKVRFHKQRLAAQVKTKQSAAQKELQKHKPLLDSIDTTPGVYGMEKPNLLKKKAAQKEKVNHMD